MSGNHSRIKGRNFEQDVARALRLVFPNVKRAWEAHKGLGYDLENTGSLRFQCKRTKGSVPMSKLKGVPGPIPVLVAKTDRQEATATLKLTDLVEILKEAKLEAWWAKNPREDDR